MTENSETIGEEDDAETTGTEEMKLSISIIPDWLDYSTDKEIPLRARFVE